MPNGLWLPQSARERDEPRLVYRCQVPGCDKTFARPQERSQYRRHVVACAKRNADRIEAEMAHQASNVFTGSMDAEREGWIRKREEDPLKKVDYIKDGLVV